MISYLLVIRVFRIFSRTHSRWLVWSSRSVISKWMEWSGCAASTVQQPMSMTLHQETRWAARAAQWRACGHFWPATCSAFETRRWALLLSWCLIALTGASTSWLKVGSDSYQNMLAAWVRVTLIIYHFIFWIDYTVCLDYLLNRYRHTGI